MNKQLLFLAILLLFAIPLFAQEDPSIRGFTPPQKTAAQRAAIDSPFDGLMVYQTDAPTGYYWYKSGGWKRLMDEDEVNATVNAAVATATTPLGASIAALIEATATVSAFAAATTPQNIFPFSTYSFPNNQNVTGGITIGSGGSTFTFAKSGTYIITYTLNTGSPAQSTAGAYLDGVSIPYGVAGPSANTLTTSFAVTLSDGSVLTIRNTSFTLLTPPSATINIVRV